MNTTPYIYKRKECYRKIISNTTYIVHVHFNESKNIHRAAHNRAPDDLQTIIGCKDKN